MEKKELSLYLHIPFCRQKCRYCDFLSAPANQQTRENYVQALLREIEACQAEEKSGLTARGVKSVYIGGGTPSILEAEQMERIINKIKSTFNILDKCEISMEMNPGTVTEEKCQAYADMGIRRISIGLQSVSNQELRALGRIHTYEQFLATYEQVRRAGISNVNIDLMSALPGQTTASYTEGLRQVLALRPEHISAYSLIIEENTPFYEIYNNGCDCNAPLLPTEEEERRMYELTKEILAKAGYDRYEISNYARQGFECVHNIVYWRRGDYLGLGLGSASLLNNTRYQNTASMETYLKCFGGDGTGERGSIQTEMQQLTKQEQMEEFMFLGLRMTEGVNVHDFENEFGIRMEEVYADVLTKYQKMGLLAYDRGEKEAASRLFLTDHGIDVSNQIFQEFLL